ncbi:high mobility group box domain-containing protein, partial [Mycotypha africana]|uniref:high mobility group box domain-containing protein n=1 Tax=Mycotypha africana TaxID=64632 RepID=UPI002300B676
RPLNAFMLYRSERKVLFGSRFHAKEVSKMLGQMWRREPDTTKAFYQKKADRMKLEHLSKYPEYRYLPQSRKKTTAKQHNDSDA